MTRNVPTVLALSLVAPGLSAQRRIEWQHDFDRALAVAKAEKRPILVAIHMDGEPACDAILAQHYRDARVVKLAGEFVNVFCSRFEHRKKGPCPIVPSLTCAEHQAAEHAVRQRILKTPAGSWVVAPQHVFLGPDGQTLGSVRYKLTVGELEWSLLDALNGVSPDFEWKLSDAARAPRRWAPGLGRSTKRDVEPPSRAEVEAAIKEVRKGGRSLWGRARKILPLIVRSPERVALDFGAMTLKVVPDKRKAAFLRTLGATAPGAWWEVVSPYAAFRKSEDVRAAAVIALERLAEPRSFRALNARFKRERSPLVKARILRALAAVAPKKQSVLTLVGRTVAQSKDEVLRAHAILAAAKLEDRETVLETLALGLADDSPKVRSTVAYVVALRRDRGLLEHVKAVLAEERDETTRRWLTKAMKVVEKRAPLDPFRRFEETVLGDGKR